MAAFFDEIIVKSKIVGFSGEIDDRRVVLIGLNNDRCGIKVSATDATNDLSEKLESFFFAGEVWQGKTGVGLNNADRGEVGKV